MENSIEKAIAALEALPEALREIVVARLIKQAETYCALKDLIAEGMEDLRAGRVTEWNLEVFLQEARAMESGRDLG